MILSTKMCIRDRDKGTLIVEATCQKPRFIITGIAGKKDFAAVTVEKAMMNSEVGFCRKVLQVFEENGIAIEHMPSGIDTMSVFVHQDELKEMEQKVIAGIHREVAVSYTHLDVYKRQRQKSRDESPALRFLSI